MGLEEIPVQSFYYNFYFFIKGSVMDTISPKVIGNGMIANAFSSERFYRKVLVFASGVSNSQEVRRSEFQRERELVERVVKENSDSEIVYFSSTSVLLPSPNAYFQHKKRMEELIANSVKTFYIFRLPQVVGLVLNNTLVSYLARSFIERRCIEVHENAVRNLIDIDDVVRIVNFLVNDRISAGSAQTLASASNVRVPDLVSEVRALLDLPCELNFVRKGDDQTVSIDFLRKYLDDRDPILGSSYGNGVLRKYIPLLKERISGEKADSY